MKTEAKPDSALRLAYRDGTRAETLYGHNFTVDANLTRVTICLDFIANLKPWNKTLLSYAETREFIEKNTDLESLQVLAAPAVALISAQPKNTTFRLEIDCGEDGKFTYSVEPSVENDTALLKIK